MNIFLLYLGDSDEVYKTFDSPIYAFGYAAALDLMHINYSFKHLFL